MDIIVIGSGILGTFHAYFAALKGCKVMLIERDPKPNEATVRNFGMIATGTIASPGEWDNYALRSNEIYRQLNEEIGTDITLRQKGSLYLIESAWEEKIISEFAEQRGERVNYLNKKEVLAKYPYAKESYVNGGLYFPNDMSVDPTKLIHILQKEFVRQKRFDYYPCRTAIEISSNGFGCKVIDALGNEFTAKKVIICSGNEYRLLYPNFFKTSGLEICKVHMMRTVPQKFELDANILSGLSLTRYPAFHICSSYNSFKKQIMDSVYKQWGIHLLFKQADNGSVIIGDSHEYYSVDGSETVDYTTRNEINQAILKYAHRMIDMDFTIDQTWLGYYMRHPEKEVLCEQIDHNVFVTTGIAGKGMTTGPGFSEFNIEYILNCD